ncbi:MAG: FCD domain-containing protein [Verrucomicrobia bacterium]|nr:FCD domain-containing protein [Verrucomicrobiota bacterium]
MNRGDRPKVAESGKATPQEFPDCPSPLARVGRRASALHDHLASVILRGDLAAGNPLPSERELMRQFGVSRSVVRETIIALANQGLLKTRSGYRPVVSRPDYDSVLGSMDQLMAHLITQEEGVKNLFDSRIFFEAALARWAALNARKEHIQDLEQKLLRNRKSIGVRTAFEATDIAFHDVLYAIPHNPLYPAIHRAYVEWLRKPWSCIESTEEIDFMMYGGHEAISKAIIARDPDLAEEALRRHLNTAWEFVRSNFDFRTGNTRNKSL